MFRLFHCACFVRSKRGTLAGTDAISKAFIYFSAFDAANYAATTKQSALFFAARRSSGLSMKYIGRRYSLILLAMAGASGFIAR